jgi:hypothetical protein
LTPLGERAGEEVEGEERSISRSSNTDGEEDGGVASIADRERQEQVTGEGERRGCLDLQLSVMCAQTWNKREAKKSMQVVWSWQWQGCSLLSPPNTQGSGQQAGGGEASSTACGLSEANGTKEGACAPTAHKSTKGKASTQCCMANRDEKLRDGFSRRSICGLLLDFVRKSERINGKPAGTNGNLLILCLSTFFLFNGRKNTRKKQNVTKEWMMLTRTILVTCRKWIFFNFSGKT